MNDSLPLVIANLKAHKTWQELNMWLDAVGKNAASFDGTVIFCPSTPFIAASSEKIKSSGLKIKLGIQDISQFEQGAYTGEVAASQVASLVTYAIIGHSERRQNFKEDDEVLAKKVQNAKNANIEPIFCAQGAETPIPEGVEIVAYEPVFAIGTGNPDNPENAHTAAQSIKARLASRAKGPYTVIYGGSVSGENAQSFLKTNIIDGFLVATNSLDPQNFIKILNSVSN